MPEKVSKNDEFGHIPEPEFMQLLEKSQVEKVNKKDEFVHLPDPILPANSGEKHV